MVDDDFSLFGGGFGDVVGYFLNGVHFEEFGEVVSGFWVGRINMIRRIGDEGRGGRFLPVFHVGFLRVCEGVEDVVFFALRELRHEMDKRCHEDEAKKCIESVSSQKPGRRTQLQGHGQRDK